MTLHPTALAAARAARSWHIWGRYAASRFCLKRAIPWRIITLARVLAQAERSAL